MRFTEFRVRNDDDKNQKQRPTPTHINTLQYVVNDDNHDAMAIMIILFSFVDDDEVAKRWWTRPKSIVVFNTTHAHNTPAHILNHIPGYLGYCCELNICVPISYTHMQDGEFNEHHHV